MKSGHFVPKNKTWMHEQIVRIFDIEEAKWLQFDPVIYHQNIQQSI